MIEYDFLEACENCPNLEAESKLEYEHICLEGTTYCHKITCINIDKCRTLIKHLQKEVKKDGR